MTLQELQDQALRLSPTQRAELIESLLSSFNSTDRAQVDSIWADEVERRRSEYEQGGVPTASANEVFRKIDGE